TLDALHAEITGAVALADFINRNDTWMIEARGRFRLEPETFQMRVRRPRPKPDDFQGNDTIQTLLVGAKNHPLTATPNFLEQFVIAKIEQWPGAGLDGHRIVSLAGEGGFEEAGAATLPGHARRNRRSTSRTNSWQVHFALICSLY